MSISRNWHHIRLYGLRLKYFESPWCYQSNGIPSHSQMYSRQINIEQISNKLHQPKCTPIFGRPTILQLSATGLTANGKYREIDANYAGKKIKILGIGPDYWTFQRTTGLCPRVLAWLLARSLGSAPDYWASISTTGHAPSYWALTRLSRFCPKPEKANTVQTNIRNLTISHLLPSYCSWHTPKWMMETKPT